MTIHTPVVFLIFRRPDLTARVFEAIRQAQPKKLLVVADGPRNEAEALLCQQARAVTEQVDWDCEVLRNYSDVNLGCRKRVSSGLDWAFEQVNEAIVLEDDCLPHPTFFRYCEELLEYYRDDQRVMHISGDNFQHGRKRTRDSYYFSHYAHVWGWASWRRAWQNYDVDMKLWQLVKDGNWLADILKDKESISYWENIFQSAYEGKIDTWDYQWLFACWLQNSLSVMPNVNLVSNIGFGKDATHTRGKSKLANIPMESMDFPLQHPLFTLRDTQADELTGKEQFARSLLRRVKRQVKQIFPTISGVI